MTMNKNNKLILLTILILTMVFATACNDQKEAVEEPVEEVKYAEAYTDVLKSNESAIRTYDWQREATDSYAIKSATPTALYDLNSDGIPELFYFAATDKLSADLHIYSMVDGAAKEISYSSVGNSEVSSGASTLLNDHEVAAGVTYVIYINNEGQLTIYFTTGDESIYYYLTTLTYDGGTSMTVNKSLYNVYGPNSDYSGTRDDYCIDGAAVSFSEGSGAFASAFKSVGTVIMYSGKDDNSLYKNFSPSDAIALSYDDMIAKLASE